MYTYTEGDDREVMNIGTIQFIILFFARQHTKRDKKEKDSGAKCQLISMTNFVNFIGVWGENPQFLALKKLIVV